MKANNVSNRRQNSVFDRGKTKQSIIKSILNKVGSTTDGYDTTNSKSNKKEQNSLGVPIANECAATGCLIVPLARSHNAFHIIGDAGAA